jgi:hypothetical protein
MAKRGNKIHVATTRRRYKGKVYETHLLRRTFREDGKVKHETVGNISHLPPPIVEIVRRALRGEPVARTDNIEIVRSLPHGHVAAALGAARACGIETAVASRRSRERDIVMAMIVARVIDPGSKLETARELRDETAASTLGLELGIGDIGEDELYSAMDWLLKRQTRIENKLAKKHLRDGTLVLYDVSSSYYTGSKCPLAKHGYSRDHRGDLPQIVYGLLCAPDGCPVAVEVFEGNTADPNTLDSQIKK